MANQNWNDWKFQKDQNKLECLNPINSNEQRIHFVCLLKNSIQNIIIINAHWVGHAKLKPLDTDDFSKENKLLMT